MMGSAAATGAAAAGSARSIAKGSTCSHQSKNTIQGAFTQLKVKLGNRRRFLLERTSVPPLSCGTPSLVEPRACEGDAVRGSSNGGAASVQLTAPPRLRVCASACNSSNSHNRKQSDFQTDCWNKRALTLLEPSAGASAGIICGDQMDHINLSLLFFYSAV